MSASHLQLESYFIDSLSIQASEEYGDADGLLEIAVVPKALQRKDDKFAHQLVLDVTFRPAKPKSAPYAGRILGRAIFHVSTDVSDDDMQRLVLLNGGAILFGLLRAQVSQVTALGRWGTLLLPPMNLVEEFALQADADSNEPKPGAKANAKREARATTKANATKTPEARGEASRKANVSRGATGRSAAAKKAAATRAAARAAKREGE